MSNETDRLMSEDPLNLSAQDIDEIIAYNRRMKKSYESGVKPSKTPTEGPKINLQALGILAPQTQPKVTRR